MPLRALKKDSIYDNQIVSERRKLNSIGFWTLQERFEQKDKQDPDIDFVLREAATIQDAVNSEIQHSVHNETFIREIRDNLVNELKLKFDKRLKARIEEKDQAFWTARDKYLEELQEVDTNKELLSLKRTENRIGAMLDNELEAFAAEYINASYTDEDNPLFTVTTKDELDLSIRELKNREKGQLAADLRQAMVRMSADNPFLARPEIRKLKNEIENLKGVVPGTIKDPWDGFVFEIEGLVQVDMNLRPEA